jgi:hypothetical protein
MHFEYTVLINQPVEKVFGYVSNPANLPEWQGPPTEIRDLQLTTPGQLRVGDKFTTVLQFLSRRYETPTQVSTYEPNRRLILAGCCRVAARRPGRNAGPSLFTRDLQVILKLPDLDSNQD